MNNSTILIKVKNRLNKLSSNDYSNLDSWIIVEAFNKAQLQWSRRNLHATNQKQEGADQSTSRLDDFQILLSSSPKLNLIKDFDNFQSNISQWPVDYFRFERLSLSVTKECCPIPKRMKVYLGEESNVDIYLGDENMRPDYDWGQTFCIISANTIKVYDDNFNINECKLIYYRFPNPIQITGIRDLSTNLIPIIDVECEFGDDLIELLVDEAAGILAFDTGDFNQGQRLDTEVEKNN